MNLIFQTLYDADISWVNWMPRLTDMTLTLLDIKEIKVHNEHFTCVCFKSLMISIFQSRCEQNELKHMWSLTLLCIQGNP